MNKVICPNCGKDITENEFSIDSEVNGVIDTGYDCPDCGIEVMTYSARYMFKVHQAFYKVLQSWVDKHADEIKELE